MAGVGKNFAMVVKQDKTIQKKFMAYIICENFDRDTERETENE